jgi:hypothetical protein
VPATRLPGCFSPSLGTFRGNRFTLESSRMRLVLVELLSSLCYQRQIVTSFVHRHLNGFIFGLIATVLLCGLASLQLQIPNLAASDDVSHVWLTLADSKWEAGGTARAADWMSVAARTAPADDVANDVALPFHRGLSRARKIEAQRFQSTVRRVAKCRNGGRPVESVAHSPKRDLLYQFCIQRI